MSEQTLDQTMMKFAAETAGEEELEAAEALPPAERTAQTVALEIRTLQKQAQGIILAYAIEIGRKLCCLMAHGANGSNGNWTIPHPPRRTLCAYTANTEISN